MPFTFSHPAIVLPLNYLSRRWVSLTGLVIGSMTPDFEYFIRMDNKRLYTHSWTGVVCYDLPLGILLAFLFHNVVRNPLIHHLPAPLQQRLDPYTAFPWNRWFRKKWAIVMGSLLIGSISHLLWDAFTHEHGFVVRSVPALKHRVHVFGFMINNFWLLQAVSSVLGMAAIVYALYQLPIAAGVKVNRHLSSYWGLTALLTLVIFFIRRVVGVNRGIVDIVIPAISAFLMALVLVSFFMKPVERPA